MQSDSKLNVVDDFLPPTLFEAVAAQLSQHKIVYGAKSNSKEDPFGHWSTNFVRGGRSNLAAIKPAIDTNPRLNEISTAWQLLLDRFLPGYVLIRCYMNAYTYGCDGYFHTDSNRADDMTAILYLNEEWDPDWAGETCFLNASGDIEAAVLPKRNRLVLFNSSVKHAGRGLSRKCPELRKVLVFKARRPGSAEYETLSQFLAESGATKIKHRRGTLHDHLLRTFGLLERRGQPLEVCFAGGLHSIYGTNKFQKSLFDGAQRDLVRQKFGAEAERLAHLFSVLDRPGTLEEPLDATGEEVFLKLSSGEHQAVSKATFHQLRFIECANLLDQSGLGRHPSLNQVWEAQ